MMYVLCVLLLLNVAGFGVFGRPSAKSEEIQNVKAYFFEFFMAELQRPELSWLQDRGGQLLVFGDVGDAEYFVYGRVWFACFDSISFLECYMLAATLLIVHPAVILFSIHASYVIHRAKVS